VQRSLTEKVKRALVTGGAGFIGSNLVDRLIDCGYRVRVLDDLSTGKLDNIHGHLASGEVEFVEGDIRDRVMVNRCVEDVDVVVHLAAQTSVPFSVENKDVTYEVNLEGTLNVLRSCAKSNVNKMVFSSTCAVYGDPVFLPITEEHPTKPISPYASSKLAAEKSCLGFNDSAFFSTIILRFFNVYGPRQALSSESGVVTQFVDRLRRGLPLVVYGDGSQTRDFIFVSDVVDVVMDLLVREDLGGEVFNVGSGVQTSIHELAETFLDLTGSNLEIVYESSRAGDVYESWADITKMKKVLGIEPLVGLREGLGTLILKGTANSESG
jgi:UDP-glucose 4-epimerase